MTDTYCISTDGENKSIVIIVIKIVKGITSMTLL